MTCNRDCFRSRYSLMMKCVVLRHVSLWTPSNRPSGTTVRPPHSLFCLFRILGSEQEVFNLHVLLSCASSIFSPFSFMSFLITSPHLRFGLHIFRCPSTSIFHVLDSTSSVFLSTWSLNHLGFASLIILLMFATSVLALISSILIISILFKSASDVSQYLGQVTCHEWSPRPVEAGQNVSLLFKILPQ